MMATTDQMTVSSSSSFMQAFRGKLSSTLRWHDWDQLWQVVHSQAGQGWYIYAVGEVPPQTPATEQQVQTFLAKINQLLRQEHEEDYCGIVYTNDFKHPSLIKIYDPNNLGVSCGYSDNPPLPGWVLSTDPPVDLPSAMSPPNNRKHWWQRVFAS